MKKLLVCFLSVLLFSFCLLSAQAAAFPDSAVIVVSETAAQTELYAAGILQESLAKSGLQLAIVTDKTEKAPFEILIGSTSRTQPSDVDAADGAYQIKSFDGGIQITGSGNRGTIYGTYAFLEKVCGFHWYSDTVTVTPAAQDIDLADDILIRYSPAFEYTDTDWVSPRNDQFSLANGLNGGPYRVLRAEQGGTVDYISNFCHTLATQFCSADTYFTEHPEYFALHGGLRVPQQLCLTNETVFEIVRDEVFAILEEKHDPDAAVQIISLTQHDNQNYCQCDTCAAVDEANGSPSGTMITFVNRIAAEVKDAGYDNIAIDTFAYQYTRKAPTQVVPLDNVIVRLCTIECCFSHPLNDDNCEQNAALKADLENWNKICDRIYVWDYATNYAYTLGIFPDFGVLQSNMQFFRDHGVKGVYEEGNYYMSACDTEFGDLRAYLLAKLLQDPDCDMAAETAGFLTAFYGEGGEDIGRFLTLITENAANNHLGIYYKMTETLSLNAEQIAQCDAYWAAAKEKTTDADALARIARSELSWRFWKACNKVSEFKGLGGFKQNRQLYLDILALGTVQYCEGNSEFANISKTVTYTNPQLWRDAQSAPLGNILAIVAYAAVVAAALALFILAIRKKKYLYLVHFPLLAAGIEIVMWNRRAYIAWRDLDEFALTIVLFSVIYAFVGTAAAYASPVRPRRLKAALCGIGSAITFPVLYFASTYIINIIIYDGKGNQLAVAVGIILYSLVLTGMLIKTICGVKKSA